jgi:hypothetical protein
MPGIESFGRRRSGHFSEELRTAEKLRDLYQRALDTANKYIPLKLGPGSAPLAGILLNYIFADEVLRPDDPEELEAARKFAAINRDLLRERAEQLIASLPVFRAALIPTLWVKRIIDQAHGRDSVVAALVDSWAFRTYSEEYPFPTIQRYEIIVRDFEEQFGIELAEYISRSSEQSDL